MTAIVPQACKQKVEDKGSMPMLFHSAHLLKEEYLIYSLAFFLLVGLAAWLLSPVPALKAEVSVPVAIEHPIRWQRIWEDSRFLVGFLKKVLLIATEGLTKETCLAVYPRQVRTLGKSWGWLFIALYLKQCASCLMTASGGDKKAPDSCLYRSPSLGLAILGSSLHRIMI